MILGRTEFDGGWLPIVVNQGPRNAPIKECIMTEEDRTFNRFLVAVFVITTIVLVSIFIAQSVIS
jgi:hypothetical protein